MNGSGSMDEEHRVDDELERRLRTYAGQRLSPDQWASIRMRAAVIEHGRAQRRDAGGGAPTRARRPWQLGWRRPAFIALVGILAVATGSTAALAASPGSPLYGARLWVETTLVSLSGNRPDAQAALIDQRLGEAAAAAGAGNEAGTDAAMNAYDAEITQAIAAADQNRDALEHLRSVIQKRLDHLRGLDKANPKAAAGVARAIARAQAALVAIDAKLQTLGPDASP